MNIQQNDQKIAPLNDEYGRHHSKHGDAVKDVGFQVENIESCVEEARKRGAHIQGVPYYLNRL